MSKRREGRETAVQLLFSRDFCRDGSEPDLDGFFELHTAARGVRAHASALYLGVVAVQTEIDARIAAVLENFSMERLGVVDRNILRLAVFEMFHVEDVPPIVAINEAIEIAKRLGGPDSGRFVNGVLDRLKTQLTRPLREATRPPAQGSRPPADRS
jgi:N utilization substance protein B